MKKQKRQFPHIYIILLAIIFLSCVLTFFVPQGKYERVQREGKEVIDPASYHLVQSHPIGLWGFLQATPKGLVDTANIIFFIFIVGGSLGVLEDTGAITAALQKLAQAMKNKGIVAIPIIMLFFGFAGAVIGMAEETLPFIPIVIALMTSLGFDTLTGAMVVLCGAGSGFASAFLNPFTIGIAQGIAGLPLFSALVFRVFMFAAFECLTIGFVCFYALKTKTKPSLVGNSNINTAIINSNNMNNGNMNISNIDIDDTKIYNNDTRGGGGVFSVRYKLILIAFLFTIVLLVFGVIKYGWYMTEISALFLALSFVVAFIAGMGFNGYATSLAKNMAGITSGALIVGFAKGIPIVLQQGQIMDTMLYAAAFVLNKLPSFLVALGMYVVQCLLNFLLPSGGGQAAVSMPIMAPLADMTGITRQASVIAFQLGDGISNIFFPTSGYFMAGLALAGIPWQKWARAVLPLILLQYALGAVFVIVAWLCKLGPF